MHTHFVTNYKSVIYTHYLSTIAHTPQLHIIIKGTYR